MNDRNPPDCPPPSNAEGGRWLPTSRLGKLGHLVFWTAVFYGLTWGIARLCEWLSP